MKRKYCIMNFLAFFAISMVNTQMIPFLTSIGYSLIQRGYLLAMNAVVAIFAQFLFGYLCDKYTKIKPFFALAYVLLLVSSVLMLWQSQRLFWYHLGTVACSGGMVKVIMGLNETWMLEADSEHYGLLRSFGALGLTIGSPIAGWLSDAFGYFALIIALSAVSVLCFIFMGMAQDVKKSSKPIQMKSLGKLLKNVPYLLLVVIYLLIYMIGTADQYVVVDKLLSLGENRAMVGLKWALQAFMEVPLFLLADKILKRFELTTLLCFGTVMYAIKFALYALGQSGWWIIATASLQIVTLPIVMLTSKLLIKAETPKELSSSAQMFAMAVFVGGSGLITPLITSRLCDAFGYDMTLCLISGFTLAPLALICYYMRLQKRKTRTCVSCEKSVQ